jgi:hypothetical protein
MALATHPDIAHFSPFDLSPFDFSPSGLSPCDLNLFALGPSGLSLFDFTVRLYASLCTRRCATAKSAQFIPYPAP